MVENETQKDEISIEFEGAKRFPFGDINKYKVKTREGGMESIYHNKYITMCDKERFVRDVIKARKVSDTAEAQKHFREKGETIDGFIRSNAITLINDLRDGKYYSLHSLEKTNNKFENALMPLVKDKALDILSSIPENP